MGPRITFWRALIAPQRPWSTQKRPKRLPETTKKRFQVRLGALWKVSLRGDFESQIKIVCGNGDFLKSMLSLRREHSFWRLERPKMELRMHPICSSEAKGAEEERKNAQDDPRSAPEATFATHPTRFGLSEAYLAVRSASNRVEIAVGEG